MKVEIINILDRSGSMASIDREACGGFNSFISEQQAVPGEARVTTVRFDDRYEIDYQGRDIHTLHPIRTLDPRGMTALLDAIGRTITEQERRINAEGWAEKVIVNIVTDGHENASHEWKPKTVKSLITRMQELGWSFIFLAANQDAFAVADTYGIDPTYVANFAANAAGTIGAMGYASATTRALRGTTF